MASPVRRSYVQAHGATHRNLYPVRNLQIESLIRCGEGFRTGRAVWITFFAVLGCNSIIEYNYPTAHSVH